MVVVRTGHRRHISQPTPKAAGFLRCLEAHRSCSTLPATALRRGVLSTTDEMDSSRVLSDSYIASQTLDSGTKRYRSSFRELNGC